MALTRWAPLLMMIVADVFPGGCCGGARYHGPPPGPPQLTLMNHGTVDICQTEWLPADGSGQAQKLTASFPTGTPEQPLKPATSRSYPLPADHFTLRVLDCDGKELMAKDLDTHGVGMVIDYR